MSAIHLSVFLMEANDGESHAFPQFLSFPSLLSFISFNISLFELVIVRGFMIKQSVHSIHSMAIDRSLSPSLSLSPQSEERTEKSIALLNKR